LYTGTGVFWAIYLICLNLDPTKWFKPENIILVALVPGPTKPKDLQPYLRPLVEEFKRYGPRSEGEEL
jgi:hypothetical protein